MLFLEIGYRLSHRGNSWQAYSITGLFGSCSVESCRSIYAIFKVVSVISEPFIFNLTCFVNVDKRGWYLVNNRYGYDLPRLFVRQKPIFCLWKEFTWVQPMARAGYRGNSHVTSSITLHHQQPFNLDKLTEVLAVRPTMVQLCCLQQSTPLPVWQKWYGRPHHFNGTLETTLHLWGVFSPLEG